jgi:hypothetical protein
MFTSIVGVDRSREPRPAVGEAADIALAEGAVPAGRRPDDHVIVIFGATGDLARRKLLPGLFHLAAAGLLPERWRIVGTASSCAPARRWRRAARW